MKFLKIKKKIKYFLRFHTFCKKICYKIADLHKFDINLLIKDIEFLVEVRFKN